MSYYINPIDGTDVEIYLINHGKKITQHGFKHHTYNDVYNEELPVIFVNNGITKVAGIAYNNAERERFLSNMNGNETHFWLIPINKLGKKAGINVDLTDLQFLHTI